MNETICPDCGERNARGVEFCSACGAFLAWDGQDDPQPDPSPRQAVQGAPVAPPPVQPGPAAAAGGPGRPAAPAEPTWRPTQPVVAAGEQIVRQPAAQAWNAAAPALGAQLPGGISPGSVVQGTPLQGASWQGAVGGFGHGASQQGGPQQGSPPQGPPAYQAPPEPPPPTEGPCPRCGVVNGAELRFCRKCGLALRGPVLHDGGGARPQSPPERIPWWRRWFRPAENTRRAARAAYRHSLPVRYRIIRWGLGLFGIGAIIAALTLIGQNPVGWAINNWNDLVGKTAQVEGLQAFTEPEPTAAAPSTAAPSTAAPGTAAPTDAITTSSAASVPDTAGNVLDNLSDTSWATPWSAAIQATATQAGCVSPSATSAPGSAGSILLVPSESVTLKKVSVAAGLPKDDSRRMLQWRPKTIQLAFSNGECQQIVLDDVDGLQEKDLDTVDTTQVRLSIIDAYPPASDQPVDLVAVTEIRLFERP